MYIYIYIFIHKAPPFITACTLLLSDLEINQVRHEGVMSNLRNTNYILRKLKHQLRESKNKPHTFCVFQCKIVVRFTDILTENMDISEVHEDDTGVGSGGDSICK